MYSNSVLSDKVLLMCTVGTVAMFSSCVPKVW